MYLTRLRTVHEILPGFLPGVATERDRDTVFKAWLLDDTLPSLSGSWSPVQEFFRHRAGREWVQQTTGHLLDIYLLDAKVREIEDVLAAEEEGGPFEHFLDVRGERLHYTTAIQELAAEFDIPRSRIPALVGFVSTKQAQICTVPLYDCTDMAGIKQRIAGLVDWLQESAAEVLGLERTRAIVTGRRKADLDDREASKLRLVLEERGSEVGRELRWRHLGHEVQAVFEAISSTLLRRAPGSERMTALPSGLRRGRKRTSRVAPVDLNWQIRSKPAAGGIELVHELSFPSGRVDQVSFSSSSRRLHENELSAITRQSFEALEAALRRLSDKGEPLVGPEIRDAVVSVGANLRDRLVPRNVQNLLDQRASSIGSALIVSDEAGIPWELIRIGPSGSKEFLCQRAAVGRWLCDSADEMLPAIPMQTTINSQRLLGVVNGRYDHLPDLPAARREAQMLRKFLDAHRPTLAGEILENASSADFLHRLQDSRADLLHFMGHGNFTLDAPDLASLAFADRDVSAQNLTSEHLSRLVAEHPLVFLNVCRAGRTNRALTGIGGWPDRWIRLASSSALICPQWAVKDSSAHRFAEEVYSRLGQPETTLGSVIKDARLARLDDAPNDPTPLAYVLYGHPNAIMVPRPTPDESPARDPLRSLPTTETSQSLLGIPQRTWESDRSPPGALLRAEYGVVDFHLREREMDDLREWSMAPGPIGVRLMTGPGGFGKTRLAKELCLQMRQKGWQAGFVDEQTSADEVWASMTSDGRAALAVVDYAESREELLIPLLKKLWSVERGTYRLILLARAALDWWEHLKTQPNGVGELVSGPATQRTFVRPLASSEETRRKSYQLALDSFCKQLGRQPPGAGAPELQDEMYERVLMIHMHSLAAAHGMESLGELGILDFALDRERRYWRRLLEARGLPRSFAPAIETAICLLTLSAGAQSEDEAIDLVGRLSAYSGRPGDLVLQVVHLLHDAYPGHGSATGRWIEPLMPDLLGEHLQFRLLGTDPRGSSHEILRILMRGDLNEEIGGPEEH